MGNTKICQIILVAILFGMVSARAKRKSKDQLTSEVGLVKGINMKSKRACNGKTPCEEPADCLKVCVGDSECMEVSRNDYRCVCREPKQPQGGCSKDVQCFYSCYNFELYGVCENKKCVCLQGKQTCQRNCDCIAACKYPYVGVCKSDKICHCAAQKCKSTTGSIVECTELCHYLGSPYYLDGACDKERICDCKADKTKC